MLNRDSEIEIWSTIVLEFMIWTQPSGPLCLCQCLYFSLRILDLKIWYLLSLAVIHTFCSPCLLPSSSLKAKMITDRNHSLLARTKPWCEGMWPIHLVHGERKLTMPHSIASHLTRDHQKVKYLLTRFSASDAKLTIKYASRFASHLVWPTKRIP